MRIEDIGGEFALIDRLARLVAGQHADLIVGVGDDAAVIRTAPPPAPYLLVTTDILVEDRHFNRQWSRAEQIGIKAVECNVSDIAAMGGNPSWMFISLVLSESTDLHGPRLFTKALRRPAAATGSYWPVGTRHGAPPM
jgi:thiamine-monophosphate kinase